ncbi:unnamed protein product [Linum tenue]|uniref:Uncharacterized protein n=1 Tax=Linum tenue TaxID=586396 RepID=A0AAV0LI40_9ROSI|nr:unnamed protein product [Linum tenue]
MEGMRSIIAREGILDTFPYPLVESSMNVRPRTLNKHFLGGNPSAMSLMYYR